MKRYLTVFLALFLCVGCKTTKHTAQEKQKSYVETQQGVTVSVRAISADTYTEPFQKEALAKGFQPVEITIENRSASEVVYSGDSMGISTVSREEVQRMIPPKDKATSWSVGAFLIWPMIASATEGATEVVKEFNSISEQVIPVSKTIKGVVFIPKEEYHGNFRLTLHNPFSDEIIGFNVQGI